MPQISPQVKKALGFSKSSSDEEARAELKKRKKLLCKPCWEVNYCPYGPIVENFPTPGLDKKGMIEHNIRLKKILSDDGYDDGRKLARNIRKDIELMVSNFDPENYVDDVDPIEDEMGCKIFGHICPVYFVAEMATESKEKRIFSRSIPDPVKRRVARRDNNMCQVCETVLIDEKVEFDHKIPFSLGGPSNERNVRVVCGKCNKKRSNKSIDDILSEDPFTQSIMNMAAQSENPEIFLENLFNEKQEDAES